MIFFETEKKNAMLKFHRISRMLRS